jgi:hypothetical protein
MWYVRVFLRNVTRPGVDLTPRAMLGDFLGGWIDAILISRTG